ncbi:NYN domain-containing protein [Mesorhizobium sp. 8]|uniref:NYN domain-containing protein n=1 Tax=Mesorhizobium sp. 8 TaxID=2584466 RepID=UPI0011249948|nr:NYN domain-containing protein [Mesorhizobium sp. 8]QDC00103.1 NYN domain-containing protein [Mesorhizobium sp. 8]
MQVLALLIDGENISAKLLPELEQHIVGLGEPVVKCVFGDFTENRLSDWVGAARDHGLELVFQVSGGKGKNSTDIALTIRAMELLHANLVEGFCLVSNDRDFLPLTTKLRQRGKKIYGFGDARIDGALRKNFTQFFLLGTAPSKPAVAPLAKTTDAAKPTGTAKAGTPLPSKVVDLLRDLSGADPVGSIHLSVLAATMRREVPDLAAQICGKGKFLKNLKQTGQIEQVGKGGSVRVRLRHGHRAATA